MKKIHHMDPFSEANIYESFAQIFPKQKIRHIYNDRNSEIIPIATSIKDLKFSEQTQYQVHQISKDEVEIKAIHDSQIDYYIQRKDKKINDWLTNHQLQHCIVIYENYLIDPELTFNQLQQEESFIELTLFNRQLQKNEILVTVYQQEKIIFNDVVNCRSLILNEIQNLHLPSQRSFYIMSNNQIIQERDTFVSKFGLVRHCNLYYLEYDSLLQQNQQLEVTIVENGEVIDTKFINYNELIFSALVTHFNKQNYFVYHNGFEVKYTDTFSQLFQAQRRCCLIIKSQSFYYQELLDFLDKFRDNVKQKLEYFPQVDSQFKQFNKNNQYYFQNLHEKDFLAHCQRDLIQYSKQEIIDIHIKPQIEKASSQIYHQPEINTPLFQDSSNDANQEQDSEDPYAVKCVQCNQDILGPIFFKGQCNHSYHERCFNQKIQAKIKNNQSQKLNIKCLEECNRTFSMKDIKQCNPIMHERIMEALVNQIKHNYKSQNDEFFTQCFNEKCNFFYIFNPQLGYNHKCCEVNNEEN